jgi:hypothetical protein
MLVPALRTALLKLDRRQAAMTAANRSWQHSLQLCTVLGKMIVQ